jgi:hypothetical protein
MKRSPEQQKPPLNWQVRFPSDKEKKSSWRIDVNLDALNETVITLDKRWKLFIAPSGVCTGRYRRARENVNDVNWFDRQLNILCMTATLSILVYCQCLGPLRTSEKPLSVGLPRTGTRLRPPAKMDLYSLCNLMKTDWKVVFSLKSGILEYSNPTGLSRAIDWSETHPNCPKSFTLFVTIKEVFLWITHVC